MIRVVVDTNVLISAVLKPESIPAKILHQIFAEELELLVTADILTEYSRVLGYKKFKFNPQIVNDLIQNISVLGTVISEINSFATLPDPDDEIFLNLAISGKAKFLITGNNKHFPLPIRVNAKVHGLQVVSPRDFVLVNQL